MTYKKQAFISGALSGVTEKVMLETLYERIGSLCEEKGIKPFIPHRDARSDKMPDFSPKKMYLSNMKKIEEADLLIAYAGKPSIGLGMEVQQAFVSGKDIITLGEQDGAKSRPLTGCPAVIESIDFSDYDDAIDKLGRALDSWLLGMGIHPPDKARSM